jgi:uncharacterized protein (TIGR02996 family)
MNDAVFLQKIKENPCDMNALRIYADWLEDEGRYTEAEGLRKEANCTKPEHQLKVEDLLGLTMRAVSRRNNGPYDEILFQTLGNNFYRLYHHQNCCEIVSIEDIIGDLDDLVGFPLTIAEESTSFENPKAKANKDEFAWTFYRFATVKGYVTIRWYGTSNGYYSMGVDFEKIA